MKPLDPDDLVSVRSAYQTILERLTPVERGAELAIMIAAVSRDRPERFTTVSEDAVKLMARLFGNTN